MPSHTFFSWLIFLTFPEHPPQFPAYRAAVHASGGHLAGPAAALWLEERRGLCHQRQSGRTDAAGPAADTGGDRRHYGTKILNCQLRDAVCPPPSMSLGVFVLTFWS